jgi:hypothetical protein
MKNNFRTHVQHLLHAFAEAGYLPPAQEVQPLMGPNGTLMWTEVAPTRLAQPHWDNRLPTTDGSAVPTTSRPRVDARRPEPVGSSLEAPAV